VDGPEFRLGRRTRRATRAEGSDQREHGGVLTGGRCGGRVHQHLAGGTGERGERELSGTTASAWANSAAPRAFHDRLDTIYTYKYIYAVDESGVFHALADPSRRRIVEILRAGEQPVSDVVSKLAIKQSGVSRHLRILHEAGFVAIRADGQRRLYSLRAEPFAALESWLDDYRALWEARLDRFDKALEKRGEGKVLGGAAATKSARKKRRTR